MSQYIQFGPHGEMMPEYNLDPLIKAKVDKTIEVFDLNNNLLNSKRYGIMCVLESYAGMESDIILECMQAAGFPVAGKLVAAHPHCMIRNRVGHKFHNYFIVNPIIIVNFADAGTQRLCDPACSGGRSISSSLKSIIIK